MENPRVKFRIFITLSWEKTVYHEHMEGEVCDNFLIDTCTNLLVFDFNAERYGGNFKNCIFFSHFWEENIYKNQPQEVKVLLAWR